MLVFAQDHPLDANPSEHAMNFGFILNLVLWLSITVSLVGCGVIGYHRDLEDHPEGKPRCGSITWESCSF